MTEQELYDDLLAKTVEVLGNMIVQTPDKLTKLRLSGSGVLEDHQSALTEDKAYRVVNKVVEALLMDMVFQNKPPRHLDTAAYRKAVKNFYTLL
jgi:hypothetical protein